MRLGRGPVVARAAAARQAGHGESARKLARTSREGIEPRPASVAAAQLENVWKIFGGTDAAVRNLNLAVEPGEFVSLLGPSGCGKTTTLRMLAGFVTPTEGTIRIAGRDMSGVAPKDRNVGIVFQQYALFPHLTVEQNVAFGLQVRRRDRGEIARKVKEYLQLVRLVGYEERKPSQLSGGQQQRVALARALITEPQLILLDEPLGALDRKLREDMQIELQQLLRRIGITAVFVTHDQDEALTMSDRVAVMNRGVLEQLATPRELYERPRTAFVADFVGVSTLLAGTLERAPNGGASLDVGGVRLLLAGDTAWRPGKVVAAIRPEKLTLHASGAAGPNQLSGRIETLKYVGGSTEYRVRLDAGAVAIVRTLNAGAVRDYSVGESVTLGLPPQHLHVLDDDPGAAAGEPAS